MKRNQRKLLVIFVIIGVSIAVAIGTLAFQESMQFFVTPAQVKSGDFPKNRSIRVGGLVVNDSVERASDSLKVKFQLTDNTAIVPVEYTGILPDLFREGQGIVAIGSVSTEGVFVADEVLAKHDENYMPPEVAEALEAAKTENKI